MFVWNNADYDRVGNMERVGTLFEVVGILELVFDLLKLIFEYQFVLTSTFVKMIEVFIFEFQVRLKFDPIYPK